MRTNIEFGALSSIASAEMKAVEGGAVLAVTNLTGTAISRYTDEITARLNPVVIGPDRLANIGDPLAR